MNERLLQLREKLVLSQQEFGERIGVSRFSISNYEAGVRNITNRVVADICREFNVDENWLRTGEGEMFIEADDSLVSQLAKEMKLNRFAVRAIRCYLELDDDKQQAIEEYVIALADSLKNESLFKESAREEYGAELVPEAKKQVLSDEDIDAEVESYRRELLKEKRAKEGLSAFGDVKESS